MRILDAIGRKNETTRPEEAVSLRVLTLATMLVAVAAIGLSEITSLAHASALTGVASPTSIVSAATLLPLGSLVSHLRRDRRNFLLKALLALAALAALARFFGDLQAAATVDDARIPLADLFLAVVVIHSFDMPQRRDLGFAVASSAALVALAGVDTRSVWFGTVVVAFAVVAAVTLVGMQRSAAREAADHLAAGDGLFRLHATGARRASSRRESDPGALRAVAVSVVALLGVGVVAFLFLPRSDGTRLGGLPFSGLGGASIGGTGVVNPGLPYGGARVGDTPAFSPDAYPGFAEVVDLRLRGELSSDLVLRVRSNRPRLLRGVVFDMYDGSTWRRSAPEPELVVGIPARINRSGRFGGVSETTVQTIELQAATPNLLFAAAEPTLVYHAAGTVSRWDDGTLTTGAEQEAGVVYSVVSELPARAHAHSGPRRHPLDAEDRERYLQLPSDLPARVRDLAEEITAGASTPLGKAVAIEEWLGVNVEYALDMTPQPPGADTVDWFLFEHRRGWCEPIASSMVVLLRAVGVPTRLATGFMPGPRNPLTGWHDIRLSDAHAWVEVWDATHGSWTTFDPTGAVPPAALGLGSAGSRIVAVDLFAWLRERVAPAVRDAVPPAAAGLTAALVALAGISWAVMQVRRRRPPTPFGRLERATARRGLPREPWQTLREYGGAVAERFPAVPKETLQHVVEAEEARRYAGGDAAPSDDDVREVIGALRR